MLKTKPNSTLMVACVVGMFLNIAESVLAQGIDVPLGMRPAPGKSQTIELLGGDKFTGEMKSFIPGLRDGEEDIVSWVHRDAVDSIRFKGSRVARIQLNYLPPSNLPKAKIANIHLRNGDMLSGMVSALTGEVLRLQTWYAGEITIPREEVMAISAGEQVSTALFEGPNGTKGWTGPNLKNLDGVKVDRKLAPANNGVNGWSYKNNAFYTGGSGALVGRSIKFPDMASISFDLQWMGYFQLHVHFYGDKLEQYSGNAYNLRLNTSSATLYRMSAAAGQSSLSSTSLQSIRGKGQGRFTLLVNRKKSQITLLVDGNLKQQWTDPSGFAGRGNYLMFASQGSGSMKLNRIVVDNWDGRVPTPNTSTEGPQKHDLLLMADSDRMTGKLVAMEEQKVIFIPNVIEEEYTVPMEKIARIDLANAGKLEPLAPPPGYVKAHFTSGGTLTFMMKSWGLGEIKAENSLFKNVIIRPDAFSRIDFNLDADRPGTDDPFGFK